MREGNCEQVHQSAKATALKRVFLRSADITEPTLSVSSVVRKTHAGGTSRLQDDGSLWITPTVDRHFDARGGSRPLLAYTYADLSYHSRCSPDFAPAAQAIGWKADFDAKSHDQTSEPFG